MSVISVEEFEKCKPASDELIEKVKEWIDDIYSLEDCDDLHFGELAYNLYCVDKGSWDDEGKYQYQYNLYQLASYDENVKKWLCDDSLIDKYNVFLGQCVTRCGSYFSEYHYEFDKPEISIAYVEHIPEVVIPAHDEVKLKELKENK